MNECETIKLIVEIVNRAEKRDLIAFDRISLIMDLEHTNEQFNLRLNDLLHADNFNFAHDIVGIQNNLNRISKEMENFFVPRYASITEGDY